MITVNMREAKSRLSELVRAVEESGERVVLQRNGQPVAEILPYRKPAILRDLTPDLSLKPVYSPGYDPAEPLSEDEWPSGI